MDVNITFGEDLPFARLAARRVREDGIELVKQRLHLTASLALCHLVAHAQFGRTAVIAATSSRLPI